MNSFWKVAFFFLMAVLFATLDSVPLEENKLAKMDGQAIVENFLKGSDVGSSYLVLHVQPPEAMPGGLLRVRAEFLTQDAGHPLDTPPLLRYAVPELHELELIINPNPQKAVSPGETGASEIRVVSARDRHPVYISQSIDGNMRADGLAGGSQTGGESLGVGESELPWDYLDRQHLP